MTGIESLFTIATFLEVLTECPVQIEVESIPDVVSWLVVNLCPLEDTLNGHVGVHSDDTEP